MLLFARPTLCHLTRCAGFIPTIPTLFLSVTIFCPVPGSILLRYARLLRSSNRSLSADVGRLGTARILGVGAISFSSNTEEARRSASVLTSMWERASRDWAVPDVPSVESIQAMSARVLSGLNARSVTDTIRLDMLKGSGCRRVSRSPSTVFSSPMAALRISVSFSPNTWLISALASTPASDGGELFGRCWTSLEFLLCTRRDSDSATRLCSAPCSADRAMPM
mmetsp:Transcript_41180/g.100466  ORF Transcript_41180/g.100466 Transcript_41180/m.100466 type:complete len:223 (-) Transcript_41180:899-1567(-)